MIDLEKFIASQKLVWIRCLSTCENVPWAKLVLCTVSGTSLVKTQVTTHFKPILERSSTDMVQIHRSNLLL